MTQSTIKLTLGKHFFSKILKLKKKENNELSSRKAEKDVKTRPQSSVTLSFLDPNENESFPSRVNIMVVSKWCFYLV